MSPRLTCLVAAAIVAVMLPAPARADQLTVDLTGFKTFDSSFPGALNSQITLNLSPNAQITGISYTNLSITLSNGSFGDEFVISTNQLSNTGAAGTFWDHRAFPGATDSPATLGPVSGSFASPSNQFNSGPFQLGNDGQLLLYVYETFNDAGTAIDAEVLSGNLVIVYTPVPEPAACCLAAVAGLAVIRRLRRG